MAVAPKGKVLVSAGDDGSVKVWNAETIKNDAVPLLTWKNPALAGFGQAPAPYKAVAFTPDGKLLAVGCQRGGLTLYDTAGWKDAKDVKEAKEVKHWRWPGGLQQLAFDSTGRYLISVNNNGTTYVLKLPGR